MTTTGKFGSPSLWYRIFKYAIYCLLAYDVWLFFLDDFAASAQTFSGGVGWRNAVEAFTATVDTLAWVILLFMFELETAVIPDEKLRGVLKWIFTGLWAVCYIVIVWSFYGYIAKYLVVTDLVPLNVDDVCSLVGAGYTYVSTLDEYLPLTNEICTTMRHHVIQQIAGTHIIGTPDRLSLAKSLALTDIINSCDWLVIVVVLEAEVMLQVKGLLSNRLLTLNKVVKAFLYSVLFGCAVYWGIYGDFVDFWDAMLWLAAFVFIEMNIFDWHTESAGESAEAV